MKLFGYPSNDYDETNPLELSDVTVAANPKELRRIAKFFEQAAIDIEKYGTDFEHVHLADNKKGVDEGPDIQIYNSALLED